jgi:hypothetical protein
MCVVTNKIEYNFDWLPFETLHHGHDGVKFECVKMRVVVNDVLHNGEKV